jgi:plasmid stabilization system protein ParE
MSDRYKVIWTHEAEQDLDRLFEFLLERATTVEDLELAQRALDEIRRAASNQLASTPYSFRKAGASPLRRELVIPFGGSGYVALFQNEPSSVVILAVRHQLESDYH